MQRARACPRCPPSRAGTTQEEGGGRLRGQTSSHATQDKGRRRARCVAQRTPLRQLSAMRLSSKTPRATGAAAAPVFSRGSLLLVWRDDRRTSSFARAMLLHAAAAAALQRHAAEEQERARGWLVGLAAHSEPPQCVVLSACRRAADCADVRADLGACTRAHFRQRRGDADIAACGASTQPTCARSCRRACVCWVCTLARRTTRARLPLLREGARAKLTALRWPTLQPCSRSCLLAGCRRSVRPPASRWWQRRSPTAGWRTRLRCFAAGCVRKHTTRTPTARCGSCR
jgi:hypothetical protein